MFEPEAQAVGLAMASSAPPRSGAVGQAVQRSWTAAIFRPACPDPLHRLKN